jgi:hypothetical protein
MEFMATRSGLASTRRVENSVATQSRQENSGREVREERRGARDTFGTQAAPIHRKWASSRILEL